MKFHVALIGALLLAPFSQAMEWRKILKDDLSKPSLAAIQVETIRNDGEMITVRVTNTTKEKIKYRGYSKNSAQLFYEELKDGKWIDTNWMWCGTGMDTYTLSPGKKAEFQILRWRSTGDFRAYTLFDSIDDKRCSLVLLYEEQKTSALLQSAQNLIDRYSPEARKKLNEIDAKSTLAYAQGLKNSLQSSNWPEAQKFADQLGEKLNSGAIGACVRFLSIQAREGTTAAKTAIETYLKAADIPPEERKFFEDLRTSITEMDAEDVIDTVTVITMIVCSHKFGHEGVLIAALVSEGVKEIFQVERKPRDASGKPLKDPASQESAVP